MVFWHTGVKPRVQVRYPHMMPEDTIIWTKFLQSRAMLIDEVWYDVRVGSGVPLDSGQPDWLKRMADYTYRKRIDVVARRGRDYWIIEAKPGAGIVALGQALYYANAFKFENRIPGNVIPSVITDVVDPDVAPMFDAYGVVVFEVGR